MLLETDKYIRDFLVRSNLSGPMSTRYSVVARAAASGVPIYTSSPGDSSIGMNIAYHELMNGGTLMMDPNRDVNEALRDHPCR